MSEFFDKLHPFLKAISLVSIAVITTGIFIFLIFKIGWITIILIIIVLIILLTYGFSCD